MDLRQISYFVALYEEGSVTRAARRLNVVQPALSMQIAKLERELEQKLFERTPKLMDPTSSARVLYRLVSPILRDLADARAHMALLPRTISGRITIGVLSSVASSVIPGVLAAFAEKYPDVEVSVASGYTTTFIELVGKGQLDLAIINKPMQRLGVTTRDLMAEELVLIGARDTVLPCPLPLAAADLGRLKLILPSKRHGLRAELDRHLAAEGVELAAQLELDSTDAIPDFVAQTDWFTVLPIIAVHRQLMQGALRAYSIGTGGIKRQLAVIHRPQDPPSPAAAKLLEHLSAAIEAAKAERHDPARQPGQG
jgi:DNA-binding transcriptional LysR family regulator